MENTPIIFPGLGLEINPPKGIDNLFGLGINIRFYGVIIALGLLLAVIYGLKRSKQFGLKEDDILDGVLGIVPFAIICARLYYCFFSWDKFKDDPLSMLYIWEGGIAIYGGVIGAAIGVILFAKIKKVRLGAVLDLVALSFLIGQFIGRWGNFFNREAFGSYCDNFLAMRIPDSFPRQLNELSPMLRESVTALRQAATAGDYSGFCQVHPTFLYESLWNLVGFVVLHFLSKKRQYDGQIALGYVAWYGLGRAIIEGLRMDSLMLGDFRISQLLAAVSCFAAAAVLILRTFKKHDPANLFVHVVAAREAELAKAEEAEEPEEEPEEESQEEPEEESEEVTGEAEEEVNDADAQENQEQPEA